MGSGRYSTDVYHSTVSSVKAAGGSTFDYSTSTRSSTPVDEWKAHETLDPKGVDVRESRDSDEHPVTVPIAVIFDVTGSMQHVPGLLQDKLPTLHEILQLKGYVEHPQIMFGAVGDATSDRVPLQVGQFESDNRMDTDLGNIFLEGNGGGQNTESYELAMYFVARHTVTDAWEKRGKKGYLILVGDEHPYSAVKAVEVSKIIGDDLNENISTEAIVAELAEKWDVFFVIPAGTAHFNEPALEEKWRSYFGQNVIKLDTPETIAESIALAVGQAEEARALEETTAAAP